MGQHFFFDAGNGIGEILSAVGSLNHLAFHVPAEKFDEYRKKLKDKGVRVRPVLNHDESPAQVSATLNPESMCDRSTSRTLTASRASSLAGSRNSTRATW
jgi:catechol 2,3-dioxygenase-like lactoylglutathione lyase family enzyme